MVAIITSFIMICILLNFPVYYTEKKAKEQYLQLLHIRKLHEDMKQIIEHLPEGVVMVNQETKGLFKTECLEGGQRADPRDESA